MKIVPCPPNCSMCSGEYCARHFDKPCDCDVVDRHTVQAKITPLVRKQARRADVLTRKVASAHKATDKSKLVFKHG